MTQTFFPVKIHSMKMNRAMGIVLPATISLILLVILKNVFFYNGGFVPTLIKVSFLSIYLLVQIFILYLLIRKTAHLSKAKSLIFIAVLGLVLRLSWVFLIRNELVSDFAVYHELASALSSGKGYAITGPVGVEDLELYIGLDHSLPYKTAYRAPGTALFGAAIYSLFGARPAIFKFFNVIMSVAVGIFLFLILEKAQRPDLSRLAALIWMVYPTSIAAVNLYGSDTLFIFSLFGLTFLVSYSRGRFKFLWIALAGMVGAWTALVRSMLAPLFAAAMLSLKGSSKPKDWLLRVAVFTLFLGMGLAPWALRNYRTFQRFIPVCTSEGEFLGRHTRDNVPPMDRRKDVKLFNAWKRSQNEVEKSSEGYRWALRHWMGMVRGGPVHIAKVIWKNTDMTFGTEFNILDWSLTRSHWKSEHPGPDTLLNESLRKQTKLFFSAFYLLIVLLAFWGFLKDNPIQFDQPGSSFLGFYFLFSFIALISVMGQDRYHFALIAILMIPAAAGIQKSLAFLKGKHPS